MRVRRCRHYLTPSWEIPWKASLFLKTIAVQNPSAGIYGPPPASHRLSPGDRVCLDHTRFEECEGTGAKLSGNVASR
jgi:hypothetical protein